MSKVLTHTQAQNPHTKQLWGVREQMVGMLTQGAARGDGGPELLPLAAPWATV